MSDREAFDKWLLREMPAGTVISDPLWWAPRIWQAAQAQAGEAVGEVFVDDSYFGNGQVNANIYFGIILPHGTKLYTRPQPAQAVIAVQQAATAVNQQLLEALLEHFVGARFAIDTNMKGTAMDCINEGIAAIAAAQEQNNSATAQENKHGL